MKIFVLGTGQMALGIAQVSAQSGFETLLYGRNSEKVDKGIEKINKQWDKLQAKGKIDEKAKKESGKNLAASYDLTDAADSDLIIEAIVENLETKQDYFSKLDQICEDKTIFATNTSSLPITLIAASTGRPEKVIGMHFMQPVPVMTLVEIIRGIATSLETYDIVEEISKKMSKFPVEVKDVPGFVSNRVLQVMINEAISCVNEGVATPKGIDEVMKRGMNHPMGPLALADFIGLDTVESILDIMYQGYGDQKYAPDPLLRQYVRAGWLGRKTGKGFYNYES